MGYLSESLDRLRRPEYTGADRCIPCTVLNGVIAIAVAAIGAVSVTRVAGLPAGLGTGTVLGLFFAALIALRGYLVPGTPWITETYFPDRVLRWFDKEPGTPGESFSTEVDVERVLLRAGAVTECPDRDDLCLEAEFRTAWNDRIADRQDRETSREDLATVLDVEADRLSFEEYGDAFVASLDGRNAGQWESHAAFLADVAAASVFRERVDEWDDMAVSARSTVLNGLRLFLERCPECGGSVSLDQEVVESCCRSIDVVAVTCQLCGARLFEAEYEG